MDHRKTNLLLIGFGPHAQRIYYPVGKKEGKKHNFAFVYGIDLEEKRKDIEHYLAVNNGSSFKMLYIPGKQKTRQELSLKTKNKLDEVVEKFSIKGVIIATEPKAHMSYARWALRQGISILMDKPISAYPGLSTNLNISAKILKDYQELVGIYQKEKRKRKRILFSLMAQRRYHPAFHKVKSLIGEVFQKTNCPVTSIQSFHADGQWRLPSEIVDIDYHSYNQGFGKCCHTGYHSLDIVPWLLEAAESRQKQINNVDVFTNFLRPNDFLKQLDLKDYRKIFPGFNKQNKYSEKELEKLYRNYGEIDAFNSFAFKHNKSTITLGSVNLVHNGFSQRGWLSVGTRNLYKDNGRVRHESHFIEQGPFQAISYISYQAKEVDPKKKKGIYDTGGEYHLDIHVFRNSAIFPRWKSYRKFSVKDLNINIMAGKSRGHQEDARRRAVLEFVSFLNGSNDSSISDFADHAKGNLLLHGVYKSAARRFNNKNPLVNIKF